jgi:repressor LexA
MNSDTLPPRQRDTIDAIKRLTEKRGLPPTIRELGKELGVVNRMTVHQHLTALKEKGFVRWDKNQNRTIQIVAQNSDGVWIKCKSQIEGVPTYLLV